MVNPPVAPNSDYLVTLTFRLDTPGMPVVRAVVQYNNNQPTLLTQLIVDDRAVILPYIGDKLARQLRDVFPYEWHPLLDEKVFQVGDKCDISIKEKGSCFVGDLVLPGVVEKISPYDSICVRIADSFSRWFPLDTRQQVITIGPAEYVTVVHKQGEAHPVTLTTQMSTINLWYKFVTENNDPKKIAYLEAHKVRSILACIMKGT